VSFGLNLCHFALLIMLTCPSILRAWSMDIPPGWQETKLPLNPDVKKLRRFLGTWYEKSERQDEQNFEIQRRGPDRWFLISREAINEDQIRKAATKGMKLPTTPETPEIPRPGTRDPDATSETRATPASPEITAASSEPTRLDCTSATNHPPDGKLLRRATTMETVNRVANVTWSTLKTILGFRSHVQKKMGK
jgi:hypothetical protein